MSLFRNSTDEATIEALKHKVNALERSLQHVYTTYSRLKIKQDEAFSRIAYLSTEKPKFEVGDTFTYKGDVYSIISKCLALNTMNNIEWDYTLLYKDIAGAIICHKFQSELEDNWVLTKQTKTK